MSVPVALPAALGFGIADFAGGLAARRAPVLVVTAAAQAAGLAVLLPAVALVPGNPSVTALAYGAVAGLAGATGLLLYLRGLAVGPMGLVAPLSAVVGAGLPLVVGLAGGERFGPVTVLALGIALAAIVIAQAGSRVDAGAGRGVALGLGAGVGFGLFFVGLDATPTDSGLWPLLAGRAASVTLLGALILLRRRPAAGAPGRAQGAVRLMVVSGVFDTIANVLFLIATRRGALGVTAVIVSLYPVVVILLARVVLGERLTRMQLASAGLALGASVLLAAS